MLDITKHLRWFWCFSAYSGYHGLETRWLDAAFWSPRVARAGALPRPAA